MDFLGIVLAFVVFIGARLLVRYVATKSDNPELSLFASSNVYRTTALCLVFGFVGIFAPGLLAIYVGTPPGVPRYAFMLIGGLIGAYVGIKIARWFASN